MFVCEESNPVGQRVLCAKKEAGAKLCKILQVAQDNLPAHVLIKQNAQIVYLKLTLF